jgi:mRNA-degrading endonuclease toxin of MazEF toxin-antitoxin module
VILSPEEAIESIEMVYVVFASTTVRGDRTEVELRVDEGMPKACVLAADQIDVADKLSLTGPIVTLADEKMTELTQALTTGDGEDWEAG